MSELRGLQLQKAEFDERNTRIVAIVVDPVEKNAEVAGQLEVTYPILSDPDLRVIDGYGLHHDEPNIGKPIARPASFLVDENGVVRWKNLTANYRLRPHPEDILAEIDRLR